MAEMSRVQHIPETTNHYKSYNMTWQPCSVQGQSLSGMITPQYYSRGTFYLLCG